MSKLKRSADELHYAVFSQFGVWPGRMDAVHEWLRELRLSIDVKSRPHRFDRSPVNEEERAAAGRGVGHALELITFGPSDLLTLHLVRDTRHLAAVHSTAPVSHQRSFGAARLPGDPGWARLQTWIEDARDLTDAVMARPLHAVVQAKVDPLANLLVGDLIDVEFLAGLPRRVDDAVRAILDGVKSKVSSHDLPADVARLERLELVALSGLDTCEGTILARTDNLESLAWMGWALRALRLHHVVPAELLAERAQELHGLCPNADPASAGALPLLSYTHTVVGMPLGIVRLTAQPEPTDDLLDGLSRPDRVAARSAVAITRIRAFPGAGAETDQVLRGLAATYLTNRAGTEAEREALAHDRAQPTRFSTFGVSDILYPGYTGVTISGEPPPEPCSPVQPLLLRQLVELLGDRVLGSESFHGLLSHVKHSVLSVQCFPPGFTRADMRPESGGAQTPSWHICFTKALREARDKLLSSSPGPGAPSSAYASLVEAGRTGHWSYPLTNGALNLTVALAGLLTHRHTIENYLGLAEVFTDWVAVCRTDPSSVLGENDRRPFNHLDRVMQAHAKRESPMRTPTLSTTVDSRAGYERARDCLSAYLRAIFDERCGEPGGVRPIAPLLVDGTDSELRVKYAMGSGVMFVSALRVQQPLFWPAVAHEVEHVRLCQHVGVDLGSDEPLARHLRSWRECAGVDAPLGPLPVPLAEEVALARRWSLEHVVLHTARHAAAVPGTDLKFWRRLLEELSEVACDLAIFDSGVVGFEDEDGAQRVRRFMATLVPNLVMDLHQARHRELAVLAVQSPLDDLRSGGSDTHPEVRDILDVAVIIGFRLLAAATLPPYLGVTDTADLREALVMPLESPRGPWRKAALHLFKGALRRDRYEPTDAHAEVAEVLVERVVHELRALLDEEQCARVLLQGLAVVSCARRRTRPARHAEPDSPVRVLTKWLDGLLEEVAGEPFVFPDVWPRGGIDPAGEVGQRMMRGFPELLHRLGPAQRRRRLDALSEFMRRATEGLPRRDLPVVGGNDEAPRLRGSTRYAVAGL